MNLRAVEELIIRGATEGERNAAKKAWEKKTGKTWTGERTPEEPTGPQYAHFGEGFPGQRAGESMSDFLFRVMFGGGPRVDFNPDPGAKAREERQRAWEQVYRNRTHREGPFGTSDAEFRRRAEQSARDRAGFYGVRTPRPGDFQPGPSAREYHGHYDPFFGGRREPNPEPPGGAQFGRQVHGGRGQDELEEALRGCELGDFEIREPARRGFHNPDEYVVILRVRRGRPQYTYHPPGGPPPKEPKK